ncbi:MAG: Si-specific NAD(P)(+) transhydrogenase [Verrucomicrobia bacterium]|nr:Si-specific NAD(P)(+) transhydrogenase [Verrucomicrobiota bacterium]
MKKFELIVIGSGPAGEKAAVKAAYFGHKVALIEKRDVYGGAGVQTGTLPSKTLKETALYLSGKWDKGLYGVERQLEHAPDVHDFLFRKDLVTHTRGEEVRENVILHGVEIFHGAASFVDPHQIKVSGPASEETLYGEYIIIATGSYPVNPKEIPFDHYRICDSDSILDIKWFPKSICIVGAGVIGCEYATTFATMGTKVFLINRHSSILPFIDQDVVTELLDDMRNGGIELKFNTAVNSIEVPGEESAPINVGLESGEMLHVDMYLYAAGRVGETRHLGLENIGLQPNKRGLLDVNEFYQTQVPHIYAVGDVIGFPALASTSMDQGRAAVAHMFQTGDAEKIAKVLPYGIYTIPEVSTVGYGEQEAKEKGIDACVGKAYYKDMARGQIMGCRRGFLKVIFARKDLVIHGVQVIGPLATELVHYGMILVANSKTLMDVVAEVFNHPTLHDLYKYACYDGLSTVAGKKVKP